MVSRLKNHTSKFMKEFKNAIKLIFREGNTQITKDDENQVIDEYSHMEDDGTINLKLDNPIHSKILDVFLSTEQVLLNGNEYKVLNRTFGELELALYFQVEKIK